MRNRLQRGLIEGRANLRLAVPLALTQLATAALGITDILVMGWAGAGQLAAGVLAVHFFTILFVFVGGLLTAASPLMAHAFGADDRIRAQRTLGQALKIALAAALVVTTTAWFTEDFLIALGQAEDLAALGGPFARANAIGFLPSILMLVLRNYAAAGGHPRLGLLVLAVGIIVNAIGDYGLMFGKWGLPELGLVGVGVATALANSLMFFTIWLLIQRQQGLRLSWSCLLGTEYVRRTLSLGLPIGLSGLGQVGTFLAATFVIGLMGQAQVAGHAIALQSANFGFALLWGGAQATTIRMGWATGRQDQAGVETAAWTGMVNGLIAGVCLAACFHFLRLDIAALFLDPADPANTAASTAALLVISAVAIYQIVNAPLLVSSAALRALRDTRIPLLISLSAFWLVGSAAGLTLAFPVGLEAAGAWYGLSLAVLVAAALVTLRLTSLLPRALELTSD